MNQLQRYALAHPLRSADGPIDPAYFRDAWPLRYGLSVNY